MRAEPRRRTREPWPLALAAALVAMAGVLAALLAIALAHPDAVLLDDAFGASARYDAALRASDRAVAQGLALDVALEPAGASARVRMTLRDAAGAAVAADRVELRRERPAGPAGPAEQGLDADLGVTPDGDGFVSVVPLPRPGRWIVEARAQRGDAALVRRLPVEARP